MKTSRRKTLAIKTNQCQYCKLANKAKLRQGRDCCQDADIHNGHCRNFQPEKPKPSKRQKPKLGRKESL